MNVRSWLKNYQNPDNKIILAHVLGVDSTWLVTHDDFDIPKPQLQQATTMVLDRINGEPLAYILGYKDFYGRKFFVKMSLPDVAPRDRELKSLIPRPETETIIDMVKALPFSPKKILDVGTGSGCIAITLALELPESEVLASDYDYRYQELIRLSAKQYKTEYHNNLSFICSDLLDDISEHFDVIVANLPYVDKKWDWIDEEALNAEPSSALYADDGGLKLIKELIEQAAIKRACEYLLLEADPCQHEAIKKYAQNFGFEHIKTDGFILCMHLA